MTFKEHNYANTQGILINFVIIIIFFSNIFIFLVVLAPVAYGVKKLVASCVIEGK